MGRHRSAGGARRRGIARWPLVASVLAVLLGLGWAGWNWGQSVLTAQKRAQESACPEGSTTLRVVVAPSIVEPVSAAARSWNRAGKVVHGHCVHTTVEAIPSEKVLDALAGRAPISSIGGLPAGWVPESEHWLKELRRTKPGLLGASAESIATSGSAAYPYVGLAAQGVSDVQARAAQSFRAYLLREPQRRAFERAGFDPPRRTSTRSSPTSNVDQ